MLHFQPARRPRSIMMTRWTGWLAVVLAFQTDHATSEIVEASTVTNVVVSSNSGWDLTGCGGGGCDPRLTRDGDDNTVPNSRWSCEPALAAYLGYGASCDLTFLLDDYVMIDHIMLYVHESDTEEIAIPFEVNFADGYLTTPGLALGAGQKVNIKEETSNLYLSFDLTNGQYINLSEVEIYVDVDEPEEMVADPVAELFVVNARTVTNVVATAVNWELSADAGCGEAGCVPSLATDGQDNTVAASRWSCTVPIWYDPSGFEEHRCDLFLSLDESFTVSHIVIYVHNGDDATREEIPFTVEGGGLNVPLQTVPGTELGTGERFNMPRPMTNLVQIVPTNVTAGQVIEFSEVEIYVEVTDKSVPISAALAWAEAPAESLTTVTASASESLAGFPATATTDGDDNTVAASRWSCDGTGDSGYCELRFEFNDEYTVSHLDIYMHESANANKAAVPLDICTCYRGDTECDCDSYWIDGYEAVGHYETKPGTPLGEAERANVLNPVTTVIGIRAANLTAIGGTVSISEVEIYFRVPDASPTPAPFQSPAPTTAPTYSWDREIYDYDDDILNDDDTGGSAGRGLEDDFLGGGDDAGADDDASAGVLPGVDPSDDDASSGGLPGVNPFEDNAAGGARFSTGTGVFCATLAATLAAAIFVGGNNLLC